MSKKNIIAIGFTVDKKSHNVGGLSMMFELFCAIVQETGYNIHIISLNPSNTFVKVGTIEFKRLLEYYKIFFSVIVLFFKYPGAILYFNPSSTKTGAYRDIFLIYLAKLFGCRILIQQFGALLDSFFASLSKRMRLSIINSYNNADIIIVEGEYSKQQYSFIKKQDKLVVINNGLPEKNNIKQSIGKSIDYNRPFELFFMNNMIESKGYVDVLKAVNILINDYKLNVHCSFAGKFINVVDDELFTSIEEAQAWFNQYIIEKQLSNNVTYYNCVFDKEKADLFINCNVFLLPSYYIFEGQPTAILEALSYGAIPIVTNYRLIPEMVDETSGMFVNARDPKDIADTIKYLMSNPQIYHQISQSCINKFYTKFTQEEYIRKVSDLLRINF